jgi:hypothetical protein
LSDLEKPEVRYTLHLTDPEMANLAYLIDLACRTCGMTAARVAGGLIALCDRAYEDAAQADPTNLTGKEISSDELETARAGVSDATRTGKLH